MRRGAFNNSNRELWLAISNASRARDASVNPHANLNVRRSHEESALDPRAAAP